LAKTLRGCSMRRLEQHARALQKLLATIKRCARALEM
jgi:hypothetical protein